MELVTPPTLQQQTAGSLLAAATTPTQALQRAGFAGHGYQALACTGWRVYDACTAQTVDYAPDTRGPIVQGTPFAIQAEDDCTTMGGVDTEARARQLLAQIESAAIAKEFWTGALATLAAATATDGTEVDTAWKANPRLAATTATTVSGGSAVSRKQGVALLEQALGDALAGAPGVIHMTRGALTHLAQPLQVRREGSNILTTLDTRIVADAGYTGTSPAGATPATGEAWIYGTARPTIWRSEVEVPGDVSERTDRATNRTKTRAERYALVTLTCGVFAARITLES